MILCICGSIKIKDKEWIFNRIDEFASTLEKSEKITIIEGNAKGVDFYAGEWAKEHNRELVLFPPDYEKYGKTACSVRNEEMVKLADFVLILWNGSSYGTFEDICLCEKYNRPYKICYYGTQPAGNKYFVMAMEKLRDQFATADKDFLNTVIEKAYNLWAVNTH